MLVRYFKKSIGLIIKFNKNKYKEIDEKYSLKYVLTIFSTLLLLPAVIFGLTALIVAIIMSILGMSQEIFRSNIILLGIGLGILYIVILILSQLINVGIQHLSCKTFFKGKKNFNDTLKAYCVVASPLLLINLILAIPVTIISFIPIIGFIITIPVSLFQFGLLIWAIVIQGMIYSQIHKISQGKGVLSAFMPMIFSMILVAMLIIIGIIFAIAMVFF